MMLKNNAICKCKAEMSALIALLYVCLTCSARTFYEVFSANNFWKISWYAKWCVLLIAFRNWDMRIETIIILTNAVAVTFTNRTHVAAQHFYV